MPSARYRAYSVQEELSLKTAEVRIQAVERICTVSKDSSPDHIQMDGGVFVSGEADESTFPCFLALSSASRTPPLA